ncbi:MAG: AI-2E family transporter [Treponema sp.]|nr:AI-2E family transporter [Treponema sp.]
MEQRTSFGKSIFILLFILTFIAVATVLKLTVSFMAPVTIAMMLSFVFYPLILKMNRTAHIPWILSIIFLVIIFVIAFSILGNLLVASTRSILSSMPRYEARFTALYKLFCDTFRIPFDENLSLLSNLWNSLNVRTAAQSAAISLSSGLLSFVKVLGMILLLTVFLLIEMKSAGTKMNEAFSQTDVQKKVHTIAANIIQQVTHYISIKFLISLMTGALVGISTALIGMDFPIVWAFIAFVLNFIPMFGSIISWLITTIFAVLQFYPSWGKILFVAIMILAVNMTLGNIIEPRWEGNDLGISPFVILVSLSVWGWMWGFVGMVLAVPLMVIIKIICENVDLLKPVAVLLGNSKKHAYPSINFPRKRS